MLLHLSEEPVHHHLLVCVHPNNILLQEHTCRRLLIRGLDGSIDYFSLFIDFPNMNIDLSLDVLEVLYLSLIVAVASLLGARIFTHIFHQGDESGGELSVHLELVLDC